MAERKNFSRYNMRCGQILRSTVTDVKLDGFELPELDARFFFIKAEDIPGKNEIDVMGTKVPLLASGEIKYTGQPLLVLFGPDYESTELALEKVKVLTSPLEEAPSEEKDDDNELDFSWGESDDETEKDKAGMRKVETTLSLSGDKIRRYARTTILSWTDGNTIHTEGPAEWPELLRKTEEGATLYPLHSIFFHQKKYLSRYDEFLITPSLLAAFTAIAAVKSKLPCEMRHVAFSKRPEMKASLTTWIDENNRPRHEEVSLTIDRGAYSFLPKEVLRQAMAGLIPRYDLDSFKAKIVNVKSPTRPTFFAGPTIYSFTQSVLSLHSSRIAKKCLLSPSSFILGTNMESTRFTPWAPNHDLGGLGERIKSVVQISDYDRKWSSASLHAGIFGLKGYSEGIGLASGLSISGLSTSTAKENQFQAQITYTPKKHISITGTASPEITEDKIVKDLIAQFFRKTDFNGSVIFTESNMEGFDSGPDILSTYNTAFLSQLMKAANKLSSLIENTSPIDLIFNSQNLTLPCEFEFSGYGAAVCEIVIPKVSLRPQAKNLWLDMSLALPHSKNAQKGIKRVAIETLSHLGCEISDSFSVSIKLSGEKKETGIYSSLENTTRLLVASSYTTALWQALGEKKNVTLPSGSEIIDSILGGK